MSYEALAGCVGRKRSQLVGDFSDDVGRLWPQVVGGVIGGALWRKHPVLGFLGGSAVGRNAAGLSRGELDKEDVARSLGAHVMATAGSLSVPAHPAIGYAAGAVASGILNEVVTKSKKPFWELVTGVRNEHLLGGDQTIPQAGTSYTDTNTVLAVQMALRDRGFDPGPIDGKLGPKTETAIRAMQASIGAAQTGVIDYGVLSALHVGVPSGSATAIVKAQDLPTDGRPAKGWSQQMIQPGIPTPGVHVGVPIWKVALIALAGVVVLSTGIVLIARHA